MGSRYLYFLTYGLSDAQLNPVWHRMLYPYGNSGRQRAKFLGDLLFFQAVGLVWTRKTRSLTPPEWKEEWFINSVDRGENDNRRCLTDSDLDRPSPSLSVR